MKKDKPKLGFILQGIKTEQFSIFEERYSPKKEIGLSTELQLKIDSKDQQIGVFLGFEFMQAKNVFIKIQVSCHFKIQETSWETFILNEKLVIPKEFLAHLAMITTGTTRGILFAKTEATPFAKFIVPILNVAEMIKEDALFDTTVEPS